MSRLVLFVFLLLAVTAVAQEDARIAEALDTTTAPDRRQELLRQLAETQTGAEQLARRGIAPERDPEVVHAVVTALIRSGRHLEHLVPICRVLIVEPHSERIIRRLQAVGDDPTRALELIRAMEPLATGADPKAGVDAELRRGAVLALGCIPRRRAIEVIVQVWNRDDDPKVRDQAREVAALVVGNRDPEQAQRYLRRESYRTYWELVRAENTRLRNAEKANRDYRNEALSRADATRTLKALQQGDPSARDVASVRAKQLASAGEFGDVGEEKFCDGLFAVFSAEVARDADASAVTLTNLLEAFAALAGRAESQLLKATERKKDLLGRIATLARGAATTKSVGVACVSLLRGLGADGMDGLALFARSFADSDVRIQAIQALGVLASQSEQSQEFIGRQLSAFLGDEKDRAVRAQVLSTLQYAVVESVYAPVRALLIPPEESVAAAATPAELRACIVILRKLPTPDALETLFLVAEAHPLPDVRRAAVEEGLLVRPSVAGEKERILPRLEKLVLAGDQAVAERLPVVQALGAAGGRDVVPLLSRLQATETLDAQLRRAAGLAKLALAQRLVGGDAVDPRDLEVARAILVAEAEGPDLVALEKLARAIVRAGDAHKLKLGSARSLLAAIYERRSDRKDVERILLHRVAAEKARDDGVAADKIEQTWIRYRDVLRAVAPGREVFERLVECSQKLAELAGADNERAAAYLLDAAQVTIDDLKNADAAKDLLEKVEKRKPLPTALGERLTRIRAKLG